MSTTRDDASNTITCTYLVFSSDVNESWLDKRPRIPISIFNLSFNALLDSGASVSAIFEQAYASIKCSMPEEE